MCIVNLWALRFHGGMAEDSVLVGYDVMLYSRRRVLIVKL